MGFRTGTGNMASYVPSSPKGRAVNREDGRQLLDRIGVLKHACDVDLLVFFARHPRSLLTSEQLAAWLGYELKQIAASLEMLLDAGLLTRTQNPTHAARMFIFVVGDSSDDWVPPLLKLASTRAGRLAVKEELSRRASKDTDGPVGHAARQTRATDSPSPVRRATAAGRDFGNKVG
ncbi:MAG: hypothetical protein LC791_10545 [Acidobacteria bacterium]|nr:hypothetical protein [Acidobacteriota bacterium]